MKQQIRTIGIDDAPFDKFKQKSALVVGTVLRGSSHIDGILSTKVRIDGNNATGKIAKMIAMSKFSTQLRCIFLDGIAVAGFNVIDIQKLNGLTSIPVVVVMRHYPGIEKIKKTLIRLNMEKKISLLEKAGKIYTDKRIYFQAAGITEKNAAELLKLTSASSLIPEPVRISHLIGSGIIKGESSGNA